MVVRMKTFCVLNTAPFRSGIRLCAAFLHVPSCKYLSRSQGIQRCEIGGNKLRSPWVLQKLVLLSSSFIGDHCWQGSTDNWPVAKNQGTFSNHLHLKVGSLNSLSSILITMQWMLSSKKQRVDSQRIIDWKNSYKCDENVDSKMMACVEQDIKKIDHLQKWAFNSHLLWCHLKRQRTSFKSFFV